MKRALLNKRPALFTAAIALVLLLGSFTSPLAQENNNQQVPASVQKRESMLSILESLEKNEPYTRDENWGAPHAFPPKVYLPPVPWPEDFEFNFDFSFTEDIIDNFDLERIEKDLEEISRKIEIKMERVIRDLEKRGECRKR
ncbi:MAG: hypothetical protein ABR519_08090 [Bacteroidales bacterium]